MTQDRGLEMMFWMIVVGSLVLGGLLVYFDVQVI